MTSALRDRRYTVEGTVLSLPVLVRTPTTIIDVLY